MSKTPKNASGSNNAGKNATAGSNQGGNEKNTGAVSPVSDALCVDPVQHSVGPAKNEAAPASANPAFSNELGDIKLCGCGGVNLVVGAMTIHLTHEDVVDLQELLAEGSDMLDAAHEQDAVNVLGSKWH